MLAHNHNKSIYVKRTPCGKLIFMKIGGVALWLSVEDFVSLACVVREAFDSQMEAFLSETAELKGFPRVVNGDESELTEGRDHEAQQ